MVSTSLAVWRQTFNVRSKADSRSCGGGNEGPRGSIFSRSRPFSRKNRRSWLISVGLRIHELRPLMCRAPERCASAMSLGKTFNSAYSLKIVLPASSWTDVESRVPSGSL